MDLGFSFFNSSSVFISVRSSRVLKSTCSFNTIHWYSIVYVYSASPASSIMTAESFFYLGFLTICSTLLFVFQSLQLSVLSEPSIQAEADQILTLVNTRHNTPLNPAEEHSMAASRIAHPKDKFVGGHFVDLGKEKQELQESANQLENKATNTNKMQSVIPRNGVEDEPINEKRCDIDLTVRNHGDLRNGFEDELRKGSKQPGSGVPSHFHNSIPALLQSAHHADHQVGGRVDGSNADHPCHLTHRSPDSCCHHSHHMMMSSPVSVMSTSVELGGHSTGGSSGDESMASLSYSRDSIHQERSTESVMFFPDMFLKKVGSDDGHLVAGNDHVESELRKTTKRPFSGGPSLQHNSFPDSVVTTTSRVLNQRHPSVKSGSNHNKFTCSAAGGSKSDQSTHDKLSDSSYLQSLAKVSVPPHSGSSSKNHNSISNLVASE